MSKKLLSTGYKKVSYYHQTDTGFAVETVADVEQTLERAKALHNEGRLENAAGHHHLAEVPIVVLNAWAVKRGVTFDQVMSDNALLTEFLNDPNNEAFRVHKGRV